MIILKNRGEIDIDVIKTMGVNVKGSESAIGYFGTGLKYAIAVFLREGIDLQLWIGANRYEFYCETKAIRGKDFDLCMMRGPYDSVPLGFTTDLGKNWEVWQAYREIHSNCLDETGEIYRAGSARGEQGTTTFAIADIDTHGIFLHEMNATKLFGNHDVEIYHGESDCIFYKGIRAKILNRPSMYTYNVVRDCSLTEDRLISYDWQVEHAINETIVQMDDKDIIKRIITAPREYFESSMNMRSNNSAKPGETFTQVFSESSRQSVQSSVRDYMFSHTPKQPKTRKEKHADLLSELNSFCDSFGLEYGIDGDQITITGDLIQAHD